MYRIEERSAEFRLNSCRTRLKRMFPEFAYPLDKLKFEERKESFREENLSTDGLTVFYTAKRIKNLRNFELEEQLMHIVVHGMLGHFLHKDAYPATEYRDPIMDVQVAYMMCELGLGGDSLEEAMYRVEQSLDGDFSMKQYYHALTDSKTGNRLVRVGAMVAIDNHRAWDEKKNSRELSKEHQEKVKQFWEEARKSFFEEGEGDTPKDEEIKNRQMMWMLKKEISGKKQYGKEKGTEEGGFPIGTRKGYNYRELLQNLISVREITREQPDSIDPMLYHYGLDLYENVPLIEPLECAEQRAPGLIVIAVDVSGSCVEDATMELFWNETFECISGMSDIYGEGEFLILQCDDEIQKEEWIFLSEEWKRPEKVYVHGMGGTSFVPVFERISELQDGRKIEALLYLTDGYGEYPVEQPEYPVYFVMQEEDYKHFVHDKAVPVWIEGVRLEKTYE